MEREKERILPEEKEEEETEEKKVEQEKKQDKEIKEDKEETKKLLIVLGIIAIICIGFIIGIRIAKNKPIKYPTYQYNGFTFQKIEGLWHTKWQRGNNLYSVHLRFGPRESENVPIIQLSNNSFKINKSVYLTFDPGKELSYIALANTELSLNLYNTFGIRPIAACTKNTTRPCYKRPIINCTNTNESVIYVRKANETRIIINNNCLIIEGSGEEIVRAADKVIWAWYGIIKKKK